MGQITLGKRKDYLGVQALRFIAAALVVLTHATLYAQERNDPSVSVWLPGVAGVDIFFVISGFVIVLASQRGDGWVSAREFIVRRVIRIVPMYWLVSSINVGILLLLPQLVLHSKLDWLSVVKSYLLIPAQNADGQIEPLVGVAWTLYFESFFYMVFAAALALKMRPMVFVPGVMVLLALVSALRSPDWPPIAYYAQPIVLEFVAGMLLAQHLPKMPTSKMLGASLTVAGFGLLLLLGANHMGLPQMVFRGVPSVMIVVGVVMLEPFLKLNSKSWVVFLGAASYTLYLFHPITAPAAPVFLTKLGVVNGTLSVVLSCIVALAAAIPLYKLVDEQITLKVKGKRLGTC